jgi:hypothetical protein
MPRDISKRAAAGGDVLQILIGPALAELGAIRRAWPPALDELELPGDLRRSSPHRR